MKRKTFIIAEAGVNHNGSILIAKKMIDMAISFGADAVKFQTFKAELVVTKYAQKASYQKKETDIFESQFDMLKKLELSVAAHKMLMRYCKKKRIMFMSTPFDFESIDILSGLGLRIFKIPSGELTNLPYLKKVGGLKKKIIISTGMSTMREVRNALDVLISAGTKRQDITVLHCNTEYPTPMKDANLKAMVAIQKVLKVNVGYSDHTLGTDAAIAAVALGAQVIEKHFTLGRDMSGPDHKASLEPDEFCRMVKGIRNVELALGSGIKYPSDSESKNIWIARKSIVASKDIHKGERFSAANITVKRPGIGINPMKWNEVLGRIAKRNFGSDELIKI
ncbi:MAG: N-acetylneuraminate synthase [Candidatus Omnitrophota bacterium]